MTAANLAPMPLPGSTPIENLAARFAALGSTTGGRDQRGKAAAAFHRPVRGPHRLVRRSVA
jgi:hypothetical protein